jgi:cysteine desulfurase family protein (TIGR01976 family)
MTTIRAARTGVVASVDEIRAHFPALSRKHGGHPVAYFDGPGGTQVPRAVVAAMSDYLFHHNANTHWRYPTSIETDTAIESARVAVADFLGASASEIAFGANMTTLTFHLARALGWRWSRGDEVVVTELDHHANVAPWRTLARERGVVIRVVPLDVGTGQLDWTALERSIGSRTRLVAIGAASNALGTISDVARATELAHAAGALSFVDAVHYAPHALVDVDAIGCDFLACSAYKFYGPHIGILFGRRPLFEDLEIPKLDPAPSTAPERWETGTGNHEGMVGTAAAIDFLASLAPRDDRRASLAATFNELHARGQRLTERLWSGLGAIDDVRLHGPPPTAPRTPTIAFTVRGRTTDDVAEQLAMQGLFLSNGDFYAATVMERLGLPDGVIRAGAACYTTVEEVDRLVDAVRSIGSR